MIEMLIARNGRLAKIAQIYQKAGTNRPFGVKKAIAKQNPAAIILPFAKNIKKIKYINGSNT